MQLYNEGDRVSITNGSSAFYGCNGTVTGVDVDHLEIFYKVVMDHDGDELTWPQEYLRIVLSKADQKISPYHTKAIAKGVYGEASKIFEEIAEFEDAQDQASPVLELCELVDVIGAIAGYTSKRFNISLAELVKMVEANKRAFENGHRT